MNVSTSTSNNGNSLHLTESIDHSQRSSTQLDIEQSDHAGDDNNVTSDGDDDDDLPPLSTYVSGWKFWCHFAIWPLVFLTLNAIVVSTMVAFNRYEFMGGSRNRRYDPYNYPYYGFGDRESDVNLKYEMMKYNRMIIAVLLLVDAGVVYRTVSFLDKKVRELDMIGDVSHDDEQQHNPSLSPSSSGGIAPNVHAQVSRKLDVVLGRDPQSRVSILVSLLWLLFVGCGTVGLVSVADWLFAISPKGKQVCTKQSSSAENQFNETSDGSSTKNRNKIDLIPDDLQDWAQTRNSYYSQSKIAHMTNGVTYLADYDPLKNRSTYEMFYGEMAQLVSIGVGGTIEYHKNILDPFSFTSISGDSILNSTCFCCMYRPKKERSSKNGASESDDDTFAHEFSWSSSSTDLSLICIQSSDTLSDSVFPNVTIFELGKQRGMTASSFEEASVKFYKDILWIKVLSSSYTEPYGQYKTITTFSTVNITSMEKKEVTKTSAAQNYPGSGYDEPFLEGPDMPCYKWRRNIDAVTFLVVLVTFSLWLTITKNLSVGVVPAVAAVSITLTHINASLSLALCSLAAGACLIGLMGCIRIPISREKIVWMMYTLLCWIAGLTFSGVFYVYYDSLYNFERALFMITVASLIGFILDHPVLFLFGWAGGIWAIFSGIFLLFTPSHYHGLFAISLGIIMGSGCATVGFNLIKYRAHVVYYSRRAWIAMNAAMQSTGNARNSNQRSNPSATRYTPVMTTVHESPISVPAPVRRDNDITAGLLD
jgi:hypothetical protein